MVEIQWCVHAQSCLTLQPHGLNLPGSPVHGIFQARILEWVAISFSKEFNKHLQNEFSLEVGLCPFKSHVIEGS